MRPRLVRIRAAKTNNHNWRNVVKIMVTKSLALLGALFMPLLPSTALAQGYPNKPVTIVIPFTPGGSNDVIGRYLADGLGKLWNQTVLVENRPGAGSAIGSTHVARAKPDGYTLLFMSATLTTNAATQPNLPFDPLKDLQAVAISAIGQMVVVTGSRVPLPNLGELAKQAKAQKLFYATSGIGGTTHFSTELLSDVAGIKMESVHYKGGTEALIDIGGGRVDVFVGSVTQVLSSVANKTATPIAIAGKTRSPLLPDVPTVAEAGFPGAESDVWWGLFAPAGMPQDILARINEGVNTVMATPAAAEVLAKNGAVPARMTVEQFSAHVANELAKWKEIARKHNITAN
jgi:tripartite-type tricarboxylate transporter receptor subunit TctC